MFNVNTKCFIFICHICHLWWCMVCWFR